MLEPQLEQNQSRLLTRSYRESLLQSLADPAEAAAYRDAALEDSRESLLTAFDNVAQVRRSIIAAKDAGVGVVRTHVKST